MMHYSIGHIIKSVCVLVGQEASLTVDKITSSLNHSPNYTSMLGPMRCDTYYMLFYFVNTANNYACKTICGINFNITPMENRFGVKYFNKR